MTSPLRSLLRSTDETRVIDVVADSFAVLELLCELEEVLGHEVSVDAVSDVTTVGDVRAWLPR